MRYKLYSYGSGNYYFQKRRQVFKSCKKYKREINSCQNQLQSKNVLLSRWQRQYLQDLSIIEGKCKHPTIMLHALPYLGFDLDALDSVYKFNLKSREFTVKRLNKCIHIKLIQTFIFFTYTQSYNQMLNEQIARILQSKPESLLLAVEQNNQGLFDLQTLLQERGKQVASLQAILSSEVGLVDKVIQAKNYLGKLQLTITEVSTELKDLKEHVRQTMKKSYGQLMLEIAKVFKELCVDKKSRQQEIQTLKDEVAKLNEQIKLRSQEILHIDRQSSLEEQIRQCIIPMLCNEGGYTLGNQSLKELFAPLHQETLTLTKLKSLKQHSYEGNLFKNYKQGKGEVLYQKEYSFKGSFKNGQKHGFGQFMHKEQVVYRGEWKKDIFWGKGTLFLKAMETQFQNGMIYMGNFQNGQFHGLGVLQFEDGTSFTSEFNQGKVTSPGILKKNEYLSIMQYQPLVSLDVICK